ncbi:MAG: IS3 family transposase [Desulfobacterales bacterium]
MQYPDMFKNAMIQKMTGPGAISATALSELVNVSQATLSKWLRMAGVDPAHAFQNNVHEYTKMAKITGPKRPNDWSAEDKLKVVMETDSLDDKQLGEFLRKKGLHQTHLEQWRLQMLDGLQSGFSKKKAKKLKADAKRIRSLEKELNRKDKALAETAALLVLKKKGPGDLGGRGRPHSREQRKMIVDLIEKAIESGARLKKAAATMGISARTIIRWRQKGGGQDQREGPLAAPANKLSEQERQQILDISNSAPFRDLSPKQIVPKLADQGVYLASESTFYRVLKEHAMLAHRQASKPAVARPKEHVATGPCQVWSWDITYLQTSVKGLFFYLYMVVDVWSRKIIAAQIFAEESMEHSSMLLAHACMINGVQPEELVLHSDNGGPMKGATMLATLQKLGVVPSFSRPSVSNDNPYSESLFRTMKYRPEYPLKPFENIEQAQSWVDGFVFWYNTQHLHSSIRYVTPDDRHFGREEHILANRRKVYEKARSQNPNRWSKNIRNWNPVRMVWLNPEKKDETSQTQHLKKAA